MAGTIKPSDAVKRDPDFFKKRPKEVNWTLRVKSSDGSIQEFVGVDWEATSRFGKVENVVAVGSDGKPLFDRPVYHEARNVNIVAWGRDSMTGEVRIAIISEERPHADHPEVPSSPVALRFAQIPMGFLERLVGKEELQKLELGRHAAIRELQEETGASVVLGVTRPHCPWHNPAPSFVATWSDLYFIEVDLAKVGEMNKEETELIFRSEYLPVRELLARIREGQGPHGIFRGATSLSALMIFFAHYPEFWPKT